VTEEVWKDATVVARFADARAARVPESGTQLAVLLHVLHALPAPPRRVLDLGAGDAVLLAALLEAFPGSDGVAVDFSPPMRERAAERLRPFGARATVTAGDLATPAWRSSVRGSFDAIVSGFAIHHLTDDRKRAVYAEILALLVAGGVFLNLEHVASATPRVEALSDEAFVAHQYRARRAAGEGVSVEEVRREFAERPDRLANILAPVEVQCGWLRELGFVDVDCFWKHFELALFGGFRPGPAPCS
jgi:ubiquinone/menaquinone biosynthesis C-methylase UbiE